MFSNGRSALLLTVAALVCTTGLHAQAGAAPTKVAIINAQKAVADTQELKRAQANLETKYRPRTQAMQSLQTELANLQRQINTPNLPPERAEQLRATGIPKQKEYQRLSEDLQSDVNNERQDILGRAGRQMADVVKRIAEARGLDVVMDITNTVYFKPALDITAEATAGYDKAYPVK